MRRISKYIFFILLLTMTFNACKSPKESLQISLEKKEKEERILNLTQHAVLFDTFSGPLKMSFKTGEKGKTTSVEAQMKIKKDEAIEISLRAPIIGMEVGKMSVTPERIIIIDRINKQYFTETMSRLQDVAPFDFDFYSLQALFTNQLFIAGKPVITEEDFNSFSLKEDEFLVFLNNKDSQGINYDFVSDYTNRIQRTEMYKNKNNVNMVWEYENFGLASNNRLFPLLMNMNLSLPNDTVEMRFSFNKIDINTPFTPATSIPEKYRQVTLEQIMKLIQSM